MNFDVLILAGGEAPEGLEQFSDANSKATLKVGGRYMIEYVVDALKAAPGVGRILVVGEKDPLEKILGDKVWKIAPPTDKMLANLQIGLDIFKDSKWLLVSTCDIPLISGPIVGRFADVCSKVEADLYYPTIAKELFDAKYPTTKRTFAKLKGSIVSGGNIVMMKPDALLKCMPSLDAAIAARKAPLKLVKIIGLGFMFKYLFKMATAADIEKRIKVNFGVNARALPVEDPEIGIDVDKVIDFELVKGLLEK